MAARYDFFSEGKDKQVKIFSNFFDQVLATNARNPYKPPQSYEQAVLIAISTMEKHNVAPVVPLVSNYYNRIRDQDAPRGGRGRGDRGRGGYGNVGDRPYNDRPYNDRPYNDHPHNDNQRNDRGGRRGVEVGKTVSDVRLLKHGGRPVCRHYNQAGGCTNTMDSGSTGCVHGPTTRIHVCSIVTRASRGDDIHLCGSPRHTGMTCPNRKR